MTSERARRQYARVAGLAFLLYIAAGLAETIIFDRAIGDGPPAARLANAGQHAATLRLTLLLSLATIASALVVAVSLFAITSGYDFNLALFGFAGRLAEGIVGAGYALTTVALVSAAHTFDAAPAGTEGAMVTLLLDLRRDAALLSATCFAAGSAAFAYLLLGARAVPRPLCWLGILASALLLVALPAQLAADARGLITMLIWLPMLAFEIVLAGWLLIRGVASYGSGEPAA